MVEKAKKTKHHRASFNALRYADSKAYLLFVTPVTQTRGGHGHDHDALLDGFGPSGHLLGSPRLVKRKGAKPLRPRTEALPRILAETFNGLDPEKKTLNTRLVGSLVLSCLVYFEDKHCESLTFP